MPEDKMPETINTPRFILPPLKRLKYISPVKRYGWEDAINDVRNGYNVVLAHSISRARDNGIFPFPFPSLTYFVLNARSRIVGYLTERSFKLFKEYVWEHKEIQDLLNSRREILCCECTGDIHEHCWVRFQKDCETREAEELAEKQRQDLRKAEELALVEKELAEKQIHDSLPTYML
jgi:hypothetical protein